ncbi:MAG: MBL fold metallo-hydrolase [Solirubrobacteraceae bacterium]
MAKPTQPERRRSLQRWRAERDRIGRGERVLPGLWRLRLPLPWPGVPHCNAYAIAAGDGFVLVDTGAFEPGSMGHLERALEQVGLRVEDVRLIVCTHAHADHCGQAAIVAERAGCEVWMHPRADHLFKQAEDPEAVLSRRLEIARQSGVPAAPLERWVQARRGQGPLVSLPLEIARELVPGVEVETDLGTFSVIETPGHAPSHVCLHQPDRRLLMSGDHLLGRVSLYFDVGWSDDPVGEFLESLERVDALDARLALSGHGRPFTDVRGHVEANQALVAGQLVKLRTLLAGETLSAFELAPRLFGDAFGAATGAWLFTETMAFLKHLERRGEAGRVAGEADGEAWTAA